MKKVRNPLIKRIPRELTGEWKKYLVVALFLILTIGFVSGMYVANGSMLKTANDNKTLLKLEDGHFELEEKASPEMLSSIETGEKANVRQYLLDEASEEFDQTFDQEFKEQFDQEFRASFLTNYGVEYSDEYASVYDAAYDAAYKESYDQAREDAWNEVLEEIDEDYEEAAEDYELEDSDFQAHKISLFENFFINAKEDHNKDGKKDGTIRVYQKSNDINKASLLEGRFPEKKNEIAIDRMHADNAGISVGDEIKIGGITWKVTGLLSYVNYTALFEKSGELMFDALKFDVGMVTEDGFTRLQNENTQNAATHYAYAWKYDTAPKNETQEKNWSDDLMIATASQTLVNEDELKDYVPRYANEAVNFTIDDLQSDSGMAGVILDVLTAIIAFIFAITIANTITKEAGTIGTLRASGYTKRELVFHYMSMPVIVTILSGIIGNILGYTLFVKIVTGMYYNSYSLPTYTTEMNSEALIRTTLIPVAIMFVVNLAVIVRMMRFSPLRFLQNDLKTTRRKRALRLPSWKFITRYRIRIILQNIPNYLILFAGVFFVMVMLAMAVGMTSSLDYYRENADQLMIAEKQYVLKDCKNEDGSLITTSDEQAEAFVLNTVLYQKGSHEEEISAYGVQDGSRYVKIDEIGKLKKNEVYVSEPFAEKYGLEKGDRMTMHEQYDNRKYTFRVAGICDSCQSMAVFMEIHRARELFDMEDEEFTGFFSSKAITDLDQDQVASVITKKEITSLVDQMDHSMGSYMKYFQVLCLLLSAVLIYLLTKLIIEKNEKAISMSKILGYQNREIAGLYLLSTTIAFLVIDAVSVALGSAVIVVIWKAMLQTYSGYFSFYMGVPEYLKMFGIVLAGFLLVMILDYRRIGRIRMDEALKNAE